MFGQALRNFAIDLLDDEYGINAQAWESLRDMLDDDGQKDILNAVKIQDGRHFLPSNSIAALRNVVPDDDRSLLLQNATTHNVTAQELATALEIAADRLNNGGVAEVIDVALKEGDDAEYVSRQIDLIVQNRP